MARGPEGSGGGAVFREATLMRDPQGGGVTLKALVRDAEDGGGARGAGASRGDAAVLRGSAAFGAGHVFLKFLVCRTCFLILWCGARGSEGSGGGQEGSVVLKASGVVAGVLKAACCARHFFSRRWWVRGGQEFRGAWAAGAVRFVLKV